MNLIDISTPRYPNTFTMVDDADYDWLNQWKWRRTRRGYVVRSSPRPNQKTIYMHLEILKPPPNMVGDHRFGNTLDNRRKNLRVCTHAENDRNKKPRIGRNLPKGVSREARCMRFRAQIAVNCKKIQLGRFLTASEAESAYNSAAIKYYGEFAWSNTSQEESK